ncbi:response regulator transcription factor [Bradyrhizobium sp. 159]|uniref:response regulator transcription factor n=1 Tax=Bradyrhizobium sp. 159 TaxID=2782632 RepID=UPI001FF80106|nr:response regulator transcription factor [Bradyrhizobium sp. 159]MCK1620280.1 response regulator transcription factor [Bradyrhizobium sp. 159]
MGRMASDDARENEPWTAILSALENGAIVVDRKGNLVWVDEKTRSRLDGSLKSLELPLRRPAGQSIDCFVSVRTLTLSDAPTAICIIQETEEANQDTMSAIESVLADTTSFARTIIEKLKGVRIAQPNPSVADIELLTDREREILGLICQGKSDLHMSEQLHLSQNTIRNHVASVYRKIGVNRRSAAILWARERGITNEALAEARRRRPRADRAER